MGQFSFGSRSRERLDGVNPVLRQVFEDAIEVTPVDFTIVCGHRTREAQEEAFATGASKVRYPNSKHNGYPSLAVDFAPWTAGGIDWRDNLAFARIQGILDACAAKRGVKLRWGGDWDRDGSSRDQSFMDIGHVELVGLDN